MNKRRIFLCFLVVVLFLFGCNKRTIPESTISETIPPFSGTAYFVLNDNEPLFTQDEYTLEAYEAYSSLDRLGRCGTAMACLGKELMPTEERESISKVKPSGWAQAQYDCVDGKNLYNRCHLIGFQLSGENANEKNLITGTRYFNVEGMLPFENMVADYIKETGNHVLYRVTPMFTQDCLVAEGVRMEARSMEDDGAGICFHVYIYNYQPGVLIDYKTGKSVEDYRNEVPTTEQTEQIYILNTSSKKFHLSDCSQGKSIKEENKSFFPGAREVLIILGYEPAGCCKP